VAAVNALSSENALMRDCGQQRKESTRQHSVSAQVRHDGDVGGDIGGRDHKDKIHGAILCHITGRRRCSGGEAGGRVGPLV
jgi:hypothetical protein